MKYAFLLFSVLALTSFKSTADISPPSCKDEPERRDCVKVEDPDAKPPKHIIKKKKPQQVPVVKPRPKAANS